VYLATICRQLLHLTISDLPQAGHKKVTDPLSFAILTLHDEHFVMIH